MHRVFLLSALFAASTVQAVQEEKYYYGYPTLTTSQTASSSILAISTTAVHGCSNGSYDSESDCRLNGCDAKSGTCTTTVDMSTHTFWACQCTGVPSSTLASSPPPPPPPPPSASSTTSVPLASSTPIKCNSGGDYVKFSRDGAVAMLKNLCGKYHSDKLVLSPEGMDLPPAKYDDAEQVTGSQYVADSVTLVANPIASKGGCEDFSQPQPIDFGAMSVDECVGNFLQAVDGCGDFTDAAGKYWKMGGTWSGKCGLWTVRAEKTGK